MSRKKPLTNKVLRGLSLMVGAIDTDPIGALFAWDQESQLSPEQRRQLDDYEVACDWIRDRQSRMAEGGEL